MLKPALKQEYDLQPEDFTQHPVWMAVHGADEAESWYDSCDEATFRPWNGSGAADPESGRLLLVAATFTLPNGTTLPGAFYSPSLKEGAHRPASDLIGDLQPRTLIGGRSVWFWGGLRGISSNDREHFYSVARETPETAFPVKFKSSPGITQGIEEGVVLGFYRIRTDGSIAVDRERVLTPLSKEEDLKESGLDGVIRLAQRGEWAAAIEQVNALIAAQPRAPEPLRTRATVEEARLTQVASLTS